MTGITREVLSQQTARQAATDSQLTDIQQIRSINYRSEAQRNRRGSDYITYQVRKRRTRGESRLAIATGLQINRKTVARRIEPKKRHTAEERAEAVRLYRSGMPTAEVATKYNVNRRTITTWNRNTQA